MRVVAMSTTRRPASGPSPAGLHTVMSSPNPGVLHARACGSLTSEDEIAFLAERRRRLTGVLGARDHALWDEIRSSAVGRSLRSEFRTAFLIICTATGGRDANRRA